MCENFEHFLHLWMNTAMEPRPGSSRLCGITDDSDPLTHRKKSHVAEAYNRYFQLPHYKANLGLTSVKVTEQWLQTRSRWPHSRPQNRPGPVFCYPFCRVSWLRYKSAIHPWWHSDFPMLSVHFHSDCPSPLGECKIGRKHAKQSMNKVVFLKWEDGKWWEGSAEAWGIEWGQTTERQKQRKRLGRKTRKAADKKNTPAEKGKGVPCQEKRANLMQLKQIFKETL